MLGFTHAGLTTRNRTEN